MCALMCTQITVQHLAHMHWSAHTCAGMVGRGSARGLPGLAGLGRLRSELRAQLSTVLLLALDLVVGDDGGDDDDGWWW